MRAAICIAAFGVRLARADVPQPNVDRVDLLDGRIALVLVEGSQIDGADAAHADWGDARLTVRAGDLGTARAADVRDRIAREVRGEGQIVARIEPLALARPTLGYSVSVRAPRVVDGRELVYAAFAVDRAGRLYEVAFFVTPNDEPEAWSKLAARLAATMVVRPVQVPLPPRPYGTCVALADAAILPYPVGTLEVFPAAVGTLYGRDTVWSVWRDSTSYRAEASAGDAHVECSGATRDALERARRVVSY